MRPENMEKTPADTERTCNSVQALDQCEDPGAVSLQHSPLCHNATYMFNSSKHKQAFKQTD